MKKKRIMDKARREGKKPCKAIELKKKKKIIDRYFFLTCLQYSSVLINMGLNHF